MQTYGFLRIYDAKVGSVNSTTARLDMAMCVGWFGAAVLLSPTRMTKLVTDYYNAGGAVVPPVALSVAADLGCSPRRSSRWRFSDASAGAGCEPTGRARRSSRCSR